MNCQDFETIIVEIARNRLMDAATREQGLKHAEVCQSCSALLAEERVLSNGLKALSIETGAEEIPAVIENAVMAAFRQRQVISTNESVKSSAFINRRRLLAAAAVLLISGISLAAWLMSKPKQDTIAINPTPSPMTSPTPVSIETNLAPSEAPEANEETVSLTIRDPKPSPRRKRLLKESDYPQPEPYGDRREIVTQFYPINQTSELIPLEGGQIVRVKMPRTNLVPLGIPVNQERVDETVLADVLVSNDGLARAIRLVY